MIKFKLFTGRPRLKLSYKVPEHRILGTTGGELIHHHCEPLDVNCVQFQEWAL